MNILDKNNDKFCLKVSCKDVNKCVDKELSRVKVNNSSSLYSFCDAASNCINLQLEKIAGSLTSLLTNFFPAIEQSFRGVDGYTATGDVFLSFSDDSFKWQSTTPGGGGAGTVTSFSAGNLNPLFSTSELNATTTPALSFTLLSQTANKVFAGPATGAAATPTFRLLLLDDIPDLSSLYAPVGSSGTVTSFSAGDLSPIFTTSESTVTTTPALSFILNTQAIHTVFAGPSSGSSAAPTFRTLIATDYPVPISNLLAATGTNTIDNGAFKQEWSWNSMTDVSGALKISSTMTAAPGIGTSSATRLLEVNLTGTTASSVSSRRTFAGYFSNTHAYSGGILNNNIGVYVFAGNSTLYTNTALHAQISGGSATSSAVFAQHDGTLNGAGSALRANSVGGIGLSISSAPFLAAPVDLFGATILVSGANTSKNIGIKIDSNGSLLGNIAIQVINGLSILSPGVAAPIPTAILHLGPSLPTSASLRIEESLIEPITLNNGDVWHYNSHIWARLNGITYQIDQQLGGSVPTIYSQDDTMVSTRTVDMDSFTITWDNSGLFRIRDLDTTESGVYDFNQGVDFLNYDTDFSVNYNQTLASGVHLAFNDLNTPSNSKTLDLTSTGIGINTASPSTAFDVNSNKIRVRTAKTPSSAADTGNQGDICWDSGFVYICVASNTWKRVAIATW